MANLFRGLLQKLRGPQEDPRDIWGYSDMLDMSTPLWSGIEGYDQWREAMLQNKQPFGMVPTDWRSIGGQGNAGQSGQYTWPEMAGMEDLFPENPELNFLDPSNKMFPWQPDYPAIYQADRVMKQNMLGEQEIGKRMGVFDASEFYAKREEETGKGSPLGTNWRGGTSSVNLDLIEDQDQLYYDVLPHELGWHNWEEDPEIKDFVPYWKSKGINPNTGEEEDYSEYGDFWGHDLAYGAGPHYWKGSSLATDYSWPYSYEEPWRWGTEYPYSTESAMNLMALQDVSKKRLGYGGWDDIKHGEYVPSRAGQWTKESYVPPPKRPNMRDVAGDIAAPTQVFPQQIEPKRVVRGGGPSRAQQRLNTGGIASLWQT